VSFAQIAPLVDLGNGRAPRVLAAQLLELGLSCLRARHLPLELCPTTRQLTLKALDLRTQPLDLQSSGRRAQTLAQLPRAVEWWQLHFVAHALDGLDDAVGVTPFRIDTAAPDQNPERRHRAEQREREQLRGIGMQERSGVLTDELHPARIACEDRERDPCARRESVVVDDMSRVCRRELEAPHSKRILDDRRVAHVGGWLDAARRGVGSAGHSRLPVVGADEPKRQDMKQVGILGERSAPKVAERHLPDILRIDRDDRRRHGGRPRLDRWIVAFSPQHLLTLRPLPHGHSALRASGRAVEGSSPGGIEARATSSGARSR
jgi:hypothetical protein